MSFGLLTSGSLVAALWSVDYVKDQISQMLGSVSEVCADNSLMNLTKNSNNNNNNTTAATAGERLHQGEK